MKPGQNHARNTAKWWNPASRRRAWPLELGSVPLQGKRKTAIADLLTRITAHVHHG